MLDYIYNVTLKYLKIAFLVWKRQEFPLFYATFKWTSSDPLLY